MNIPELKTQVKFAIKAVTECNKTYKLYLQKYYYSAVVDGESIDCKYYAKHDAFFINFMDELELNLFAYNKPFDTKLMVALNNFNNCEDVESYHISTLINFIAISAAMCTAANLVLHRIYDNADRYLLPICITATSYETFQLSQTHCPDQLRIDLIGNLTRWIEE